MSESKSTTRIEVVGDTTRVVFTDFRQLIGQFREDNVFRRVAQRLDDVSMEERELLESLFVTVDYQESSVRVATASVFDSEKETLLLPSAHNLKYFETEIQERPTTEAEQAGYEDSLAYSPPDYVYEFSLPSPLAFRDPVSSSEFESFGSPPSIENASERLARKIEEAKWLQTKVSYTGSVSLLPPVWDPTVEGNDREAVRAGAKQRVHMAKEAWESVFGVSYDEWFAARLAQLGRTEPRLEPTEIVALELVDDSEGEEFCQYCGKITFTDELLDIETKSGKQRCVCVKCAEEWSEFDDQTVEQAKAEVQ